ncbi:TIGR03564 family F420-dependent LLM class oxidoreductase [Actinomadura sp. LOL_016]|uniref:TIGR03564 family F420-dependent LLM class oxidoreductase n=1 Tax=unclassified Actinomadura TaxID=2626254 RepID=UPI003A80EBC7
MRIGLFTVAGAAPLDDLVGAARLARDTGLSSVFFGHMGSWDALMAAALTGREVPGIEVGTAIVPSYPRHPLTVASQALTAQAMTGGRFTLGIGPSHPSMIEGGYGIAYERPARHTRDYLTALRPLLRGETVEHRGETLTAAGTVDAPGATPPPVILSALGPAMLRVAGELADGTVTTWTGAEAIADHIVPAITKAAESAGRPAPRVLAGTLVALTTDPDGVRRELGERFGAATDLPAYRATLERQGLSGVQETVIAGDETEVAAQLRRFADAGATDLLISPYGDTARVLELAASLG